MRFETIATAEQLAQRAPAINVDNVVMVYSGKRNACCCGCSGKYSYTSKHRVEGAADRGYAVDDEDVSDRSVKIIVSKMNKQLDNVKVEHDICGRVMNVLEVGGRMYFAVMQKAQ